jgi:uncharacterized protein (TIRG00374 family)
VVGEKSSASSGRAGRTVWIVAALAVVIVVLGIYRLRGTGFRWDLFFSTFKADWRWLSLACVCILLTYLGRAVRWQVMLRPIRPHSSLWNLTSATVIGFTAIVLLGRPGELVRPYLISVKERVPFSSQMAAWFLERILDLILVLIIFGIALARMPAGLHLGPALQWILRTGGYLVASLGALCILLLVVFRNFAVPAQARILSAAQVLPEKLYSRLAKILTAFVQGMECTHDLNNLALLMGYTILEWVVIVSAYFCVFRALPATSHFSLDDVMIFLGIVAFGSVVQIPGIGGGVQVAAFLVLHEIFKISGELATGIAILIWLLSWVLVVPVGLAFAFHEGVNWSKIRHITEDVESGTAAT